MVDECSLGTHTCDPHADCVDTPDGYTCRCKAGWQDASRELRNPGRICKKGLRYLSVLAHSPCNIFSCSLVVAGLPPHPIRFASALFTSRCFIYQLYILALSEVSLKRNLHSFLKILLKSDRCSFGHPSSQLFISFWPSIWIRWRLGIRSRQFKMRFSLLTNHYFAPLTCGSLSNEAY